MPEAAGLLLGQVQDPPGTLGEPVDHRDLLPNRNRLPAYFLWTACLVTPSRVAIASHDQPLARAFSTLRASSSSTRPRRAATAARATSGSSLPVAAATAVTSLCIVSLMESTYIDPGRESMLVDPAHHRA